MHPVTASLLPTLRSAAATAAAIAAALALGACSTIDSFLSGDKIDYKSQSAKTAPLEVPPDLTQLQRNGRYTPQSSGAVSASSFGSAAAATAATPANSTVAPTSIGEMRIVREGNQRWLSVPIPAEQLWPQLRSFWQERGFSLVIDNAETGVMETDWAENRAKIPQDVIRRTVGRVLDSLYDTGERDRFRVRVERTASGSDVFLSHRGMVEVYTGDRREHTTWTQRPSDPQLEAEFLSRLMVKLGAKEEVARTLATNPATSAPRARVLTGQPAATLQVDEGFDRAWRRVGLTLDRSGFTVEDRDRSGGLYFVRYVDPKDAATAEPGFFAKLLNFGKSDPAQAPGRYRIAVKADGERTNVSVQTAQGGPESGAVGQRIVSLLVEDLK
ncbi:MAG: outer membrane protein assembly factor BamC [Burkholderiaceae bacterium]|nr:outer membrane protein assembly factor BamC [Burkholderiaceae bacterium]